MRPDTDERAGRGADAPAPPPAPGPGRPGRALPRPGPPGMVTLYAAVWMVFGWANGQRRLADSSFLWHLRTGHWILEHGIPRSDIYSFTAPGTSWVAQSWLAEVCYALLDAAGGPVALRLFGAAVGLAIAALSFRLALRLSNDRLAAALLPASGLIAAGLVWSERPLLLGVLALLVLVWVVDVPGSPAGRRPHLVIPAVMWLWVNVHGSFALGFGFLALHLAGRWLDGAPPWRDRERALARAGLLAGAVCLVNPYGPALLWFPVALLMRGDVLAAIIEWKSPDLRTPQGMMFALFLATVLVVLARARRRPSRRDVLVLVSFLLLALWAQRNIAAAPVVALPIVSRLAGRDAPRPDARRRPHWVPLALILAFAVFWTADRLPRPAFGHDVTEYPVAAMRAVERNGLLGRRLLTTDVWAGYTIHEYWPRQRVFIDDRYDMYPRQLIHDYLRLLGGEPSWRSTLDRYRVEVVVWPREHAFAQILSGDLRWKLVYADAAAVVYTRIGVTAG